ncbi:MAG: hypothetical protein LBC42_00020, partial [Puniceicoccales bacterium]|nr:hypothetical protein [Puniceicoccales bacterium]
MNNGRGGIFTAICGLLCCAGGIALANSAEISSLDSFTGGEVDWDAKIIQLKGGTYDFTDAVVIDEDGWKLLGAPLQHGEIIT